MAQGKSGKLIAEINTKLKIDLYSKLAKDQLTFKDWLVKESSKYVYGTSKDKKNKKRINN